MSAVEAQPYISPKHLGDYLEIQTKAVFQTDMSWKVVGNLGE